MNTNQFDEALRIGRKYALVPHFAASLEFLLHQTLEVYLQELAEADPNIRSNKSSSDLAKRAEAESKLCSNQSNSNPDFVTLSSKYSDASKSGSTHGSSPSNTDGSASPQKSKSDVNMNVPQILPMDAPETKSAWIFRHVMEMLKQFPLHFPTVIVQVARKTDARYWQLIFSFAGDVITLFNVLHATSIRFLSLPYFS